jgi:hypothetical protein
LSLNKSDIETVTTDWQGIALSVSYEPNWSNMPEHNCVYAHLQVMSITREPLPITETGYRSHFLHPSYVEAAGGPVAFVHAWLDHHANKKGWRKQVEAMQQMTLF